MGSEQSLYLFETIFEYNGIFTVSKNHATLSQKEPFIMIRIRQIGLLEGRTYTFRLCVMRLICLLLANKFIIMNK